MKKISLRATVVAVAALATTSAFATDGYFPHGYGMKALGMGGASVAMTDNAFAGANNPATAAFSGGRIDLGGTFFMPKRGASRSGSNAGEMDGAVESDKPTFLIPEFGYVRQISSDTAVGLTVYGNGGMNTDYKATGITCRTPSNDAYTANFLCGSGRLGVNLEQLVVAPVFSKKLSDVTSIGVSPLLIYQTFQAKGLGGFTGWANLPIGGYRVDTTPAAGLTDNGKDSSTGIGLRLGYFTKLSSQTDFGFSYSPKVNMSRFKKYNQLFAEHGDFDIPENFSFGLATQLTPALKVAVDYQQINYSKVKAVGNAQAQPNTAVLGDSDGAGFGWRDSKVLKLGVEWKHSDQLTLRAGYNHTNNPVTSPNVTFNIIAPGVTTDHYTIGATMNVDKNSEVSFAYMYAPKVTVSGPSGLNMPGATDITDTIHMSQQSLGVQYSWKF